MTIDIPILSLCGHNLVLDDLLLKVLYVIFTCFKCHKIVDKCLTDSQLEIHQQFYNKGSGSYQNYKIVSASLY